jgi:eukaryotic-like serine/threonine-protein kinase
MSEPLLLTRAPLPLEARRHIAEECARFDRALGNGMKPRIEDCIPPDRSPEECRELLKALLEVEVYYLRQAGSTVDPDDYVCRFPGHADVIQEALLGSALLTTSDAGPPRPANGGRWPSVPGYVILSELGRGGMGVVYQARHTALNRLVALKMIRGGDQASPEDLARFRREAESVARLRHPNIVQIYEVGECDGLPYFSLELCRGGSLADRLRHGPLQPRTAAAVVAQLARAMQAAHEHNIIHRDLKPSNVLLAEDLEMPLGDCPVKVSDFGLAKQLDVSGHTEPGQVVGTPSYMSPEQAAGKGLEVSAATDVYSLGAVLYACLTGGPPFQGATSFDILRQVVCDEPVPPSRLNRLCPRDLETICLKCLRKRPAERYASARQLAEDLRRHLEGRPVLARRAGRLERLVKWARRSPAQALAVAAAAAFVLALIGALSAQVRLLARNLEESRRRDGLRERAEELYFGAKHKEKGGDWVGAARDAGAALELIKREPAFADFPLREQLADLQARAREGLADARLRAESRDRLARLTASGGDAVFFGTLASGLELPDSLARTRRAVADGLALFGVSADNDGPPAADARFYTPGQVALIADACYELLLIDAEVLARPNVGEPAGAWHGRLRQSLQLLDRADRLRPGTPVRAGLARRADYLELLGEADAARQARQAADQTPPSLAADYFLLGMGHYAREEFRQAMGPLTEALRIQPGHYGAEYVLAVCRLWEGQPQEAKAGLDRCLGQRPDFPWPRLLRGTAEMKLREFKAAGDDFEAVLRTPPDETATYVALVDRGVLAMQEGLWDKAVADLRQAIALRPDDMAAYVNLALTYRQQAEVPPLRVCALLLTPQGAYALPALDAHRRPALAEAVAVLDEAIRRRPQVARLYHERARFHLLRDDPTTARADFVRAIALAPNAGAASTLPDDLIELGRLLQREGKHAEALKVYDTVLGLRPHQADALRLKAESLLVLRRFPEAGATLDRYLATTAAAGRALAQAQKRAEALKARGLVHVEQNDFRAAIDSYTLALSLMRDPDTLGLRGWAYLAFGAAPLALPDFEEALGLRPGSADPLLGRASARVKQAKVKEALADAEEGLRNGRNGPNPSRMFYLAARVYSQAASRLRDPAARPDLDSAAQCEARAVELLRSALARLPAAERVAFWHNYVRQDGDFNPIRSHGAMRALEDDLARPGRDLPPADRRVNQR